MNNLQIVVKTLNGLNIEPGEVLSYWRRIGKPTSRKGYNEEKVAKNDALMMYEPLLTNGAEVFL